MLLEGLRRALSSMAEKIATKELSEKEISKHIESFVIQLISNDVSVEVAEKLGDRLKDKLSDLKVKRFGKKDDVVKEVFKDAIMDLFPKSRVTEELVSSVKYKDQRTKPFVILFVGPNGSGKTTTVVKMAKYLKDRGFKCLIAASDTFRAAAIEQLKELASMVGVRVVSQRYGSDPAAVAMDAISSARATDVDVVLIDTAGRTEVDKNLLDEMKKIKRVTEPDIVIYVGDALAGNVALEQARQFNEYVGIDYIVLAKLDADAKGGSAISASYITGKPLLFLGVGQELDKMEEFDAGSFVDRLVS